MRSTGVALFTGVFLLVFSTISLAQDAKTIRVGIIGLDTSHVVAFTGELNKPDNTGDLAGVRVVAAYPGGSPDIPSSWDRVKGYTEKLQAQGVKIYDSIEAMLPRVEAVLLLSIDGRKHLEQARPVLEARKPVFIDKPVAASLADVVRIFDLAQKTGTPCFSNSSLRYAPETVALWKNSPIGRVLGCDAYSSNSPLEPSHPDLYYYGIHGCESLFAAMGRGCKMVSRVHTPTADLAIGVWQDGRLGTFRGILKGQVGFGATVFGEKGIVEAGKFGGYEPLLVEIVKFFKTGKPPVAPDDTLEIYAFMEAADQSKRQGGAPISLEDVLKKARMETDN